MIIERFRKGLNFLKNQDIEIRIRLLFLTEYAALIACLIGTVSMMMYADNIITILPNFGLLAFSLTGIYLSHKKKNYDFASMLVIIGCTVICLPAMFFSSGGNYSGMPLWFAFGVVFAAFMSSGRMRVIMPLIALTTSAACMMLGRIHPEWVIPLKDKNAEFIDLIQSFILVTVIMCITLNLYLSTYDTQRKELEKQRSEMAKLLNLDTLTGIANRRAYYEEIKKCSESGDVENAVLVAMDVNGLKKVNDSYGHSAGDEFIRTAAEIIGNAFTEYGKIFRTGGDEFMAILHCTAEETERLSEKLKAAIQASDKKWADGMAIAMGIVRWNEIDGSDTEEIEKTADARMYRNKSEYYRQMGMDRRKNR